MPTANPFLPNPRDIQMGTELLQSLQRILACMSQAGCHHTTEYQQIFEPYKYLSNQVQLARQALIQHNMTHNIHQYSQSMAKANSAFLTRARQSSDIAAAPTKPTSLPSTQRPIASLAHPPEQHPMAATGRVSQAFLSHAKQSHQP